MTTGYNFKIRDVRLGRYIPNDSEHLDKYPLRRSNAPTAAVPIQVGVNWYSDFDHPVKDRDGSWWVGKDSKNLGYLRGGHSVCIPHDPYRDLYSWWLYYDQGYEGACVGFAASRMMSLLNRERYDARWLWEEAKEVDEWSDTNRGDNEGTSVRAAVDILRTLGHKLPRKSGPDASRGVLHNVWSSSADQDLSVLQNAKYNKRGAMPFLNSWGNEYPRLVWMPCETWERLHRERGEFTIITDRI
jgi:hypothetical protein